MREETEMVRVKGSMKVIAKIEVERCVYVCACP